MAAVKVGEWGRCWGAVSMPLFAFSLISISFTAAIECGPYTLQNECTGLVGTNVLSTSSSPTSQSDRFALISLDISSVRMFTPLTSSLDCRRAYIWYLCNTAFPQCDPAANCTSIPSSAACDDVIALCNESLVKIDVNCLPKEEREISIYLTGGGRHAFADMSPCEGGGLNLTSDVINNPIGAVTCLDVSRSPAPCCEDPFVQNPATLECVPGCPWGLYDRSREEALGYIAYTFTWMSTLLCFFSLFPSLFIEGMLTFPKYLTPLCIVIGVCVSQTSIFSLYAGGGAAYVCGSNEYDGDIAQTYTDFLHSPVCSAQIILEIFFSVALTYWFFVLIVCLTSLFLTDCLPFLSPINRALTDEKTSKKVEIAAHVGWALPLLWTLMNYFVLVDLDSNVTAMPGVYACSSYTFASVVGSIFFFSISTFLIVAALVTVGRRSWRFFSAQWRSVAFAVYFLFVSLFNFVPVFIVFFQIESDDYISTFKMQSRWVECVVGNSNVNPSPCTRPILYPYWYISITYAILFSWSGFITTVTYMTNPFILRWWYYLFFHRLVVRNPSILLNEIETIE